jgi:REP element-mobilizing transposase RayT
MPNYRRWFVPGGTYFFTANLVRRDSSLLVEHIDALRAAYAEAAKRQPFETVAICVPPNHLHCISTCRTATAISPAAGGGSKAGFRAACLARRTSP